MHMADSDEALLKRMSADDDIDAFRTLVKRYIDNVYALGIRLLGTRSGAEAENIAQDAMLNLWAQRHALSHTSNIFPIRLYRQVISLALNCSIHEIKNVSVGGQYNQSRVDEAFDELPFQQRAALTLAYFEHMGAHEIAATLWVSKDEAESLVQRGRRALRTNLNRETTSWLT